MGPEDEPDEGDEVGVEFDDADALVELELPAASGEEGTPRLGPDELSGLMPSAPIIVAGADWEEAVALEFPEPPSVGGVEAEGLDCCELP